LIEEELKLLNNESQNLFISGFSYGSTLALHLAYSLNIQFGGAFCSSGYKFLITKIDENKKFPLMIIHGQRDKVRPW
jgi:predicted esterase